MREMVRDYTATGKYKSENIPGNQFMEEHEREFFDKNAIVLERQAAIMAENYRSDKDDSLYDFIADLEEHKEEYVVDGALLACTRCSKQARKIKIDGVEFAGELQDVEKNSRIYTGDRPQTINGLVPAGVKDCIGGMRGEEMRAKGEGEETGEVNIVSFGNCTFIPQGEELNKILLAQNMMHKKDKIIEAIKEGKGTCYCFMRLNEEWENLAIAGEYVVGEMAIPKIGIEKALLSAPYMKFNGVEGINMLSILFCQFGGGIIAALESGQRNVGGDSNYGIDTTLLSEEEITILTTLYGEAAGCTEVAWKAIANVIMNRVGVREWSKYETPLEIIKYTGFDAYTNPNNPYKEAQEYFENRDYSSDRIERLIEAVLPILRGEEEDITNNAVLYYSPKAQEELHKKYPEKYPKRPKWAESDALEEVTIEGAENDDLKFYRYK